MFDRPTKIKEGEKREEEEKFEILRRTEFYKLFEAGILNNSLDATSSKAVWKHNSFYCCHKTQDSGTTMSHFVKKSHIHV